VNGIGFGTTELIVARPKPEEVTGAYLNYVLVLPGFSGDFSLDFLRAFRMEAVLTRISRAAN
jgi:hypothetical protein